MRILRRLGILGWFLCVPAHLWGSSQSEERDDKTEPHTVTRVNSAISIETPTSLYSLPRVRVATPLTTDEVRALYLSHLKMFLPANLGMVLVGEAVQDMIFQKDTSFYHVIALVAGVSLAVGAEARRGIRLAEFLDASEAEGRCSTGFWRGPLLPLYLQRLYVLMLPCFAQLVFNHNLGRSTNFVLASLSFVAFALTACEFATLCHLKKPPPQR